MLVEENGEKVNVVGDCSVVVRGKINNFETNMMLDSGAGVSIIDMGTIERLGLSSDIVCNENNVSDCIDASGNKMKIIGSIGLKTELNGTSKCITHNFRVLDTKSCHDIICGRDFMRHYGSIEFNFNTGAIKVGKWWLKGVTTKRETVRLSEQVELAPRSEKVIVVKCSRNHALITSEFKPKRIPGLGGVYMSQAQVVPDVDGHFMVTLLNVNSKDILLKKKQVVGYVVEEEKLKVAKVESFDYHEGKTQHAFKKCTISDNLTEEQKNSMKKLLSRNDDLFAVDPKKPNTTNFVQHRILTGDSQPIYSKPRRIPFAWEEDVNAQVEQMWKNGIIRPSSSPWNSPIILVDKKDNTKRFVCDYRNLNSVTKKDTYPLPHIHDVIDKMHGSIYWSSLDAASAYWAMPIREVDKEKTAFSAPRGKFEFNVTSYGLCNAGPSYQRLMDLTLSGLPPDRILAYMDDIVIFTKTFADHVNALNLIFERLRKSSIQLRADKCVFGADKLEFLGFVLSCDGVRPQRRLTEAVRSFATPTNRKEIRRFLGMAGFYRNFIKDFATIAKPLSELTSENVKFSWSEDCESSFSKLKTALATAPVLSFPQPNKEFILEVDASGVAVGGVLSQVQNDGIVHPVAYFSTSLTPTQRKWSTYNQEAYAMVCAVEHWHVYLTGTKFILNSDHNPLIFLQRKGEIRGKVARWVAILEAFDFEVRYIPGRINVKADALSRNSAADLSQPSDILEEKIYAVFENDTFVHQLRDEQEKCVILSSAKENILQGFPVTEGQLKRVSKQLRVENDILTKSGRPVIPPSIRSYVFDQYHKSNHFGTDKIHNLMKTRFYWPNMFNFISNEVSKCHTCAQCKTEIKPPKAPLVPNREPEAPMEFIALDIAHMPTDVEGYCYLLLIGDVFSKYIEAVPLRDQTADSIKRGLWENWLNHYSYPQFMLSDQGSNVDGVVINKLCRDFHIEKRRTSGYHSQGNGFAERNIRSVKETLRTLLLEYKLPQNCWTEILRSVVFALNTSESSATKCAPFKVIFGREPTFPTDILMGTVSNQISAPTPADYVKDLKLQIKDVLLKVSDNLNISRKAMMRQYNKNLRFNDYKPGDKVWVKRKYFKSGENRKLSTRKTGPWTVVAKKPNGVNFEITKGKDSKVIHHDRLVPFHEKREGMEQILRKTNEDDDLNDPDPDPEEYEPSSGESSDESDIGDIVGNENRRYPLRERRQRNLEGYIPWEVIEHRL